MESNLHCGSVAAHGATRTMADGGLTVVARVLRWLVPAVLERLGSVGWGRALLRRGAFVCAVGCLASCILVIGDTSAAVAVSGGEVVTAAPPWVAYVTTTNRFLVTQNLESSCTGSIVGNQWVLTAAHCVVVSHNDRLTSSPINASKLKIVLGRNDLSQTWTGAQWSVDQVRLNPNWDPTSLTNDVALLHLKGALPATALPMPIAPSSFSPDDHQQVMAFGYGNAAETYKKADLDRGIVKNYSGRSSSVLRRTTSDSYTNDDACQTLADWCFDHSGPSQIMHGDSGGPWVTTINDPFLIGVTSFNANPVRASATTVTYQRHFAQRTTTPLVHDWIVQTAGLVEANDGTIYRDPTTGASWLAGNDGFVRSIPTGGDYLCFTGQGHRVVNLPTFLIAELPKNSDSARCHSDVGPKSSILLFGDGDIGEDPSGASNLASALTDSGYTVDSMGASGLPDDISPYGQLWHYGVDITSPEDQQRIIDFVESGGSAFITGDWGSPGQFDNQAVLNIASALLDTPVTASESDCDFGEYPVNADAIDGIATTPNALTTWTGGCISGLLDIAPTNAVVTLPSGAVAVSAFDIGTRGGRLVVVMDVNWAQTAYGDPSTIPAVTENLATFLSIGIA